MIFRTAYMFLDDDGLCPVCAPSGDSVKVRYACEQTKNGLRKFVVEEVNTYEVIQSFADSCDIKKLLARYKETQDPTMLFRRAGIYADVSGLPQNLSGAVVAMRQAEEAYQRLDKRVRDAVSFDDLLRDPGNLRRVVDILGSCQQADRSAAVTAPKEEIK